MEYRPLNTSSETLAQYRSLFAAAFPPNPKFSIEMLRWLYALKPDGTAVGYDAFEGDQLAAHYACIPTTAQVEGRSVKGLLSLNTATHPDHRGKKLFEKLTQKTFELAADQGYDHVQGAANAMSTPLFVRKCGFRKICQLDAKVGLGSLGVDLQTAAETASYKCVWTDENLRWRMSNPSNPVNARSNNNHRAFFAKSFSSLVPVYAELDNTMSASTASESHQALSPLRLFIGLFPAAAGKPRGYFDIPHKFRPSPLNFLFLPLTEASAKAVDADSSLYSFLDFDAY